MPIPIYVRKIQVIINHFSHQTITMRYMSYMLSVICIMLACKKKFANPEPLASITIANLVTPGSVAKLGTHFTAIQNINPNGAANFALPAGENRLYVWPVGDSLHPFYDGWITTRGQEIYSLLLTGSPGSIASLLIKENLPQRTDSVFGVRFINLSPESPAVKVTLASSPETSEFENVAYKGVTEFKTYAAFAGITEYSFQVRDVATNALISTFKIAGPTRSAGLPRFGNISLVLRGRIGGSPAAGISRINHF